MPTNATEYHQLLMDSGLTSPEADRVTRLRTAQNRVHKPNPIKVEVTDDESADLYIFDRIGFDMWDDSGFTPKKLVEQLKAVGPKRTLNVSLNSPGGDVFDAFTIYNLLNRHEGKIKVTVDGLAASAASFLAQAAHPGELRISEAGTFMIHNAWGGVMGNKHDLRDMAGVLEKLDGQIADIYAKRSGRPAAEFGPLMDAESWFTGAEAVQHKLADAVVQPKKAAALLMPDGISGFRKAPESVKAFFSSNESVPVDNEKFKAERKRRLRLLELSGATK